jgi:hypothetical protein
MALIDDVTKAARLARAITSDIALYNANKVDKALQDDAFFEAMAPEFDEGRRLYQSRLAPTLDAQSQLFDLAIVDVILINKGHIHCKVW